MALCRDPLLTYLNQDGYNVIRRPRGGIAPLDVLGQADGNPEWLGSLPTVWRSEEEPPSPGEERPVADFNQESYRTADLSLSVGVGLLDTILQAFDAALPSIGFAFSSARRLQFQINSPTSRSIPPLKIGKYLEEGDLSTQNPFVRRFFVGDQARAYVISEVLLSRSFAITASKGRGGEIKIDDAAIQEIIKLSALVKFSSESLVKVSFEGSEPIVFGFKAFEIAFRNGVWNVDRVEPDDDMALLGEGEDESDPDPRILGGGQPLLL